LKSFIDDFRKNHSQTFVIDGGDFFNSYPFPELNTAMLNAIPHMNYDIMLPGENVFYESEKFINEYLKTFVGKARKKALDNLTSREREIVQLVAERKTTREIATILFISPKTVEAHRSNIAKKINAKGMEEIREYAIKKGYLIADT